LIFYIAFILCIIPLIILFARLIRSAKQEKENFQTVHSLKKKEYEDSEKKIKQIKEKISNQEKIIKKVLHLYEITKKMATILDWDEMLKLFRQAINEYLNLEEFLFFVANGNTNFSLVIRHGSFVYEDWIKENFNRFIEEKEIKIVPVSKQERLLYTPFWRSVSTDLHKRELMGLVWAKLNSTLIADSAEEKEFVKDVNTLVNQLVLGLEKTKLYTQVEKMSRFDGLTGLYRRHYFQERLDEEILRVKRYGGNFCLVLIDIDYFKKLNDIYGHQAGDQILHELGTILKENVYETDIVARYGGEEFVLLLPRAELDGVKRKIENLREKIANKVFVSDWGKIQVTVSLGIAYYPHDGSSTTEILNAADEALYFSKQQGRNRLTVYGEIPK